jgi:hypothetical protein
MSGLHCNIFYFILFNKYLSLWARECSKKPIQWYVGWAIVAVEMSMVKEMKVVPTSRPLKSNSSYLIIQKFPSSKISLELNSEMGMALLLPKCTHACFNAIIGVSLYFKNGWLMLSFLIDKTTLMGLW